MKESEAFIAGHQARSPGFPGGSAGKESACNAGDLGLIRGSGRSPGTGNGNLLWYPCLENSTDRGAYRLQFMGSRRVGQSGVTNTFTLSKESRTVSA